MTKLEATNIYEVDAKHGTRPDSGFCRVIRKEEINGGDPYTMTVELNNVIGAGGVDSGIPGVMFNVIDENNFDLTLFRFVTWEIPGKHSFILP